MKLIKQNINEQFKKTGGPVPGYDIKRIEHMRLKWGKIMNKRDNYDYWKENIAEPWEIEMMENAILDDEIINKNYERDGFRRDRGYIDELNNQVEDIWFSTFMLSFSKIVEEDTTLVFLGKDRYFERWWLEPNPSAAKIDDCTPIKCDPDFIYKSPTCNREVFVEQKCVYKENWKMNIRYSQFKLFNKLLNEGKGVYILIKESYNYKDVYKFYNYKDIRNILEEKNTYTITKKELESYGIFSTRDYIDIH